MAKEKKVTGLAEESADGAAVVNAEVIPAPLRKTEKPDGCAAGFYCYIGPTIQGLIRNGAIFRGTRADALAAASAAIEAQPLVKTLIVSGDALANAYRKVRQPGNALHEHARRIAVRSR